MSSAGLLDTSILIASESGRRLDVEALPEHSYLSAITIGELAAGIHAARDAATRARRLRTLTATSSIAVLPVDAPVAEAWGALRVGLRDSGRAVKVNDLWIAAVALANGMDLVTQDDDFDVIELAGGPVVIRV